MDRRPPRPPLRVAVLAAALGCAISCQAVFGDYRIDTSDVVVPDDPLPCTPGATRCSGASLRSCAPGGQAWQTLATCESSALCNLRSESCAPCRPGEYQCNEAVLRLCQSDSTWREEATCATPQLCNAAAGVCDAKQCETPGDYRCDAKGQLERCPPSLKQWEPVELCESPALCDAEAAKQQAAAGEPVRCLPPTCLDGQFICQEGSVRRCNAAQNGWEVHDACNPADRCNPKTGNCNECTPGEHACSGAQLLLCNDSRRWQQDRDCVTPGLCDAVNGTCKDTKCTVPGQLLCDPDSNSLKRCKTDLSEWQLLAACATVALCNADEWRCEPAACHGGQRCNGANLERCSSNLTRWDLVRTCGREQTCDPTEGCVPGRCTEGSQRCNDRYLEKCTEGRWEHVDRCATPELCDPAQDACMPPLCGGEGQLYFHCLTDTIVEVCEPGRHKYRAYLSCTEPGKKCIEQTGTCG